MLRAVLFDLDDTLVIADNDALMKDYFRRLMARFTQVDPKRFQQQLVHSTMHSIEASQTAKDGEAVETFLERFSRHFFTNLGIEPAMETFADFYSGEYAELGCWAHPAPGARQAVETAQKLGLLIAVATNPVYPLAAIKQRLIWAGLGDVAWNLITTGEEMHICKPHPGYFQEAAAKLGVDPHDCLMVGNDPFNDLPAAQVGMRTFLALDSMAGHSEALQTFAGATAASPNQTSKPDFSGMIRELPAVLRHLVETPASKASIH